MITHSFLQLGNQAFSTGDYSAALQYYQKALEGIRGDPDQLADLYGNIGNVYGAIGQIDQAIDFYKKAIAILRRSEAYARLGVTYVNIGNLYADQGNFEQAIHFYKQGVLLLEREEQWEHLSVLYGNFSMVLVRKSEIQERSGICGERDGAGEKIETPRASGGCFSPACKSKGRNGGDR
ncbi:MAG: tetratricopeptide repeat protein [Candidatus Manganitrophus sp.]|nr:tetratricopeptide repeat protein [Candidatus Manganitrophus sp.]